MTNAPFGRYAPPGWCQFLIRICQRIPTQTWLGKRLAFILRKPVLLRKQSPVDTIVQNVCFRLEPKNNLSDKRLLCTPSLLDGIERNFFAQNLPPQALVLDIGANIGGYGLLLAAARPDISLIAVEADPLMAKRLSRHIEFSHLEGRCTVVEAAATPATGTVELFVDTVNRGCSSLVAVGKDEDKGERSERTGDSILVQGLTLLDIMGQCNQAKVNLLKMDIEGYEFPVLEAFLQQAESDSWPDYIQLEQYRKQTFNPAVKIALEKGYEITFQTRMNVVLKKA